MRKIVLLCAMGMSTSMLVTKMKEAANSIGYEVEINAYPVSEAKMRSEGTDIILLGPQVRFQVTKIKELCPQCIVDSIDMQAYGTMNGMKVINRAKELLGD
ncbi:MAG: PTS sugar transporter subunit IIB [Erysipelotrichia bacterium]|nr:PTS sugar transporter subunit IIB [Erysipelotrichia bacterium]